MLTRFAAEVRSLRDTFIAPGSLASADIPLARLIGHFSLAVGVLASGPVIGPPRRVAIRSCAVSSRTCWRRRSRKVMPTMPARVPRGALAATWYVSMPPALSPYRTIGRSSRTRSWARKSTTRSTPSSYDGVVPALTWVRP